MLATLVASLRAEAQIAAAAASTNPQSSSDDLPLEPANLPDGYVHVPGGKVLHQSCIYEVSPGEVVDSNLVVHDSSGASVRQLTPCNYQGYRVNPNAPHDPGTGGWVASTQQSVPSGFSSWGYVSTQIEVPTWTPAGSGALLYYFIGLEPSNAGHQIIQPVLQWGTSPAGGGHFWAEADWEVIGSYAVHGPLYGVSAGDYLSMQMILDYVGDECTYEWTNTSPYSVYVCGNTYAWYIDVSRNNSDFNDDVFYQVVDSGPDAPPNGTFFPNAFPAVYESYYDTACEYGVFFLDAELMAFGASSLTTYTGSPGPRGGGLSGCNDGYLFNSGGTDTYVY